MKREELYNKWVELNSLKWDQSCVTKIQEQFEKAVIRLYKTITGKGTKNYSKAFSYLKENYESELLETKKPFEEEVNSLWVKYDSRKKMLENILRENAKDFIPEKTKELNKVKTSYSSNYRSQPSHNKYAREYLKDDETLLNILGYETKVITVNQHTDGGIYSRYWEDYELWSNLSEFDFYMVKNGENFISVLNWAVLCWQNGTNPKVYFQFLSDEDYNKSQVLAYECNYTVNKDNMKLELSWDEVEKLKRVKNAR